MTIEYGSQLKNVLEDLYDPRKEEVTVMVDINEIIANFDDVTVVETVTYSSPDSAVCLVSKYAIVDINEREWRCRNTIRHSSGREETDSYPVIEESAIEKIRNVVKLINFGDDPRNKLGLKYIDGTVRTFSANITASLLDHDTTIQQLESRIDMLERKIKKMSTKMNKMKK